jgi:hypothetical protein
VRLAAAVLGYYQVRLAAAVLGYYQVRLAAAVLGYYQVRLAAAVLGYYQVRLAHRLSCCRLPAVWGLLAFDHLLVDAHHPVGLGLLASDLLPVVCLGLEQVVVYCLLDLVVVHEKDHLLGLVAPLLLPEDDLHLPH